MKAFAYVNARDEKEAVAALSTERGKVLPLAGGMDLIALMKDYIAQPDTLVNVKGLPSTITVAPQGLTSIGAAVRVADVAAHEELAKAYPALAYAAGEVGTPQIRNLGTVGGNIMQRPRCWYFRNEEFHCLKKGGAPLLRRGRREPVSRHLRRRALPHRASVESGGADHRLRRPLPRGRAAGRTGD